MPRDLAFWYALSPPLRALAGITAVVLMMTLCWWGLVRPITTERHGLDAQRVAQQPARQARWKALLELKPPAATASDDETSEAFSPLALQSAGRQLIRWQPNGAGGELLLEAQWTQIPQTFLYLAGCNMRAEAFSLVMKENRLHFTLQLVRNDAG